MITVFLLFAIPLCLIGLFGYGVYKFFKVNFPKGYAELEDHVYERRRLDYQNKIQPYNNQPYYYWPPSTK